MGWVISLPLARGVSRATEVGRHGEFTGWFRRPGVALAVGPDVVFLADLPRVVGLGSETIFQRCYADVDHLCFFRCHRFMYMYVSLRGAAAGDDALGRQVVGLEKKESERET